MTPWQFIAHWQNRVSFLENINCFRRRGTGMSGGSRLLLTLGGEHMEVGVGSVKQQRKSNKKEREETMINREDYHLPPKEGFVLTHFLTVADVNRSAEFYLRILGGTVVRSGEPTIIHIANSWLILNVGGGPTDDKPTVTLRPPQNPNEVSSFLNIRVADIRASYEEWRSRGAEFLTEPKDHGMEIRCYMRDPDGYIIEVGQTTTPQA
jgi:lactoylglutathione lyase